MNCIIVEDDELTRQDFEHKVSLVSFLELVSSCASGKEAAGAILNNQVDLVILDVMLPDMNGMQFLETMNAERPQIILVSSNQKFAADAFEYEVTDFITKPVSNERFFKAIAKAKKICETGSGISSHDDQGVFIKVNSRLVRIETKDILFAESLADYVNLYTTGGKYTIHSTMKALEGALPEKQFFRAHNRRQLSGDK